MTIYAQEIIDNVRVTLSDVAAKRYTDERLLKLLDDGIKDIAKNSSLFITREQMFVYDNVADYNLSEIMIELVRVEYNDEPLDFKTYADMDKINRNWQTDSGDKVKYIVYDNNNAGQFKVYPIPENSVNDNITYTSNYGIITSITFNDILPTIIGLYGDIGSIPRDAVLTIFYVRRHPKITSVDDELVVDELTLTALEHYVAGFALRDNHDQQNRALASEELKIYQSMMNDYSIQRFRNFTAKNRTTTYRGAFDA